MAETAGLQALADSGELEQVEREAMEEALAAAAEADAEAVEEMPDAPGDGSDRMAKLKALRKRLVRSPRSVTTQR
jgi:hypothetical protein